MFGDRYQVQELLDDDGSPELFRAIDSQTGIQVAVKCLYVHDLNSVRRRRRFTREFKLLSLLQHPNIVRVLDYGYDHKGAPCLVTEFLDGRSLRCGARISDERRAARGGGISRGLS